MILAHEAFAVDLYIEALHTNLQIPNFGPEIIRIPCRSGDGVTGEKQGGMTEGEGRRFSKDVWKCLFVVNW